MAPPSRPCCTPGLATGDLFGSAQAREYPALCNASLSVCSTAVRCRVAVCGLSDVTPLHVPFHALSLSLPHLAALAPLGALALTTANATLGVAWPGRRRRLAPGLRAPSGHPRDRGRYGAGRRCGLAPLARRCLPLARVPADQLNHPFAKALVSVLAALPAQMLGLTSCRQSAVGRTRMCMRPFAVGDSGA